MRHDLQDLIPQYQTTREGVRTALRRLCGHRRERDRQYATGAAGSFSNRPPTRRRPCGRH